MRKKMYKAKKHWVIASAAALSILGTSGLVAADELTSEVGQASDQPAELASSQASQASPDNQEQEIAATASTEAQAGALEDQQEQAPQTQSQSQAQTATSQAPASSESQQVNQANSYTASQAPQEPANLAASLVRASAATTVARTAANSQVTSAKVAGKTLTLVYNRPKAADEVVKFAVWSDEHGQDDMVWYQANAQGAAYVDLTRHKNYGRYHVHTYSEIKGQMIGREANDNVMVNPSKITSKLQQQADGSMLLTVSQVGDDITGLSVPVWSDKNGQDDMVWYTAQAKDKTTYTLKIDPARHHNDSGHYNVHIYGHSAITGGMVGLAATPGFNRQQASAPQVTAKNEVKASLTNQGLALHLDSNESNIQNVRFAVWSEVGGQDDLRWYEADANRSLTIPYKNHFGYGTYQIHTYADKDGKQVFLNQRTLNIPAPSAKAQVKKVDTYHYQVKLTGVPSYIRDVKVPVWTDKNGQDDINWYSARKNADGSYVVSVDLRQHGLENGHYNAHIYGYSDLDKGNLVGLGATGFTVNALPQAKPVKNQVKTSLNQQGLSLHLDSNESNIQNVRFAVWSEAGGQDDLKWYEADGNRSVTAPYKNHSGYGTYNIHVYADKAGKQTFLTSTKMTVPSPSIKAQVTKLDDYRYKVAVTNVPAYVTAVKVPVWTEKNGQDDVVWYAAQKNAQGGYDATVLLKNHNFETGRYLTHVYGDSSLENGKTVGLGATEFRVTKAPQAQSVKLEVRNHDAQNGTLQVVLTETDKSKKAIKLSVAAWSAADQSNIHWYDVAVSNGSAQVQVDERFHSYIKGDYRVHAYVTYQYNSQTGKDLGHYSLQKERVGGYFIDVSSWNGNISVDSYRSLKNQGITGVVVKLTEGTSYINPYAARQIANAKAAGLKVSAYHFSRYQSAAGARAEAAYFVNAAKSFGLTSATAMVNDMESSEMLNNINANTAAWTSAMKSMGYNNLIYYTMASWLDTRGGRLSTSQLGMQNMWVAHYVNGYNPLSQEEAKNYSLYKDSAAWQYTSVSRKLGGSLDESIDYTGRLS